MHHSAARHAPAPSARPSILTDYLRPGGLPSVRVRVAGSCPHSGNRFIWIPGRGGTEERSSGQGAKMQENTGRSIFIGNIPYTATEDQLQVRSPARPSRAGGGPRERQLQH